MHRILTSCALILSLSGGTLRSQATDPQTEDEERAERQYFERQKSARSARGEDPAASFLAEANRLVHDTNYRSAAGTHYEIRTDDPRLDARAAAALLDAFETFFDAAWPADPPLHALEGQTPVFLLWSYHDYNKLLGADFSRQLLRPKGHYLTGVNAIALHTDPGDASGVADSLLHEATHHLVARRLYTTEHEPPPWLSEGLADYFGFTWRARDGAFAAGEVGGKVVPLIEGVSQTGAIQAVGRRRQFLAAADEAGAGGLVTAVVAIPDVARFYAGPIELHYAASWLLVHWLLHGDDGTHRAAFHRWIALDRRGEGGPAALWRELGVDPAEVDAAVLGHARRLSIR